MNRNGSWNSVRNALAALPLMLAPVAAKAADMTAGVVMEKMESKERAAYLAGVAEGLAYARYAKDGKQTDGMKCINDWFYNEGTLRKIHDAFTRFNDYLPGAVMAAMVEKECGS